jgi:hypothetical protein
MRPSRTRLTLAGTLLTLALAAVSGCDPGGPDTAKQAPTTQASVSPPAGGSQAFEQAQKLTRCMQANGVPNFPSPRPDGSFSPDQLAGLDMATLQQVFLGTCRRFGRGLHHSGSAGG